MTESAKPKLLVVDDDQLTRTMVKDHFEEAGYFVDTAHDVSAAMAKLARDYDAILSDIVMPGSTGLDLLQQIRARNPLVKVFLITARPTLKTLDQAKRYGASAYFRKPLKLPEVEARIRGFLGTDSVPMPNGRPRVEGQVLVVNDALLARLKDRLESFEVSACAAAKQELLQAVKERHPKVVLADAGAAETQALLREYRRLGREANSFLLVCDEASLKAANTMLLHYGATGCIPAQASRELFERCLQDAVSFREAQKEEEEVRASALAQTSKCEFARAYRNGYYCVASRACPHGPFQEGWIMVESSEHQKCGRRPLLVSSLDRVGFANWVGAIDAAKALEARKVLMDLVCSKVEEIVIDAQGVGAASYNLIELLSDVHAEMAKVHPEGLVHVINLTPALLSECRKAISNKAIRFYGARMVDERSAFERWGVRFD